MYRIFISYRRSDGGEIARALKKALNDSNYFAFLDTSDLQAGLWDEQLKERIASCPVFVPIITEGYIERLNDPGADNIVLEEFKIASERQKEIIPYFADEGTAEQSRRTMLNGVQLGRYQASIADVKKLLQLIAGVCPTAGLEAAEDASARYIETQTDPRTNPLYDPGKSLPRRITIGRSTGSRTLDDLDGILQDSPALCISGDGGCGKTYLLQQIFRALHKNIRYIPIYVRLADIAFPRKKTDPGNGILAYVESKITGGGPDAADGSTLLRELRHGSRLPTVVFLIDGLNEASNEKTAIQDVNGLTEISVRTRVILTTRYIPSDISSKFVPVHIEDLTDEEIRDYLGMPGMTVDEGSVLKLPLYLRLYKRMLQEQSGEGRNQALALPQTKRQILNDVFIRHPMDEFGNTLPDELRAAYAYLLPYICFLMANDNTLSIQYQKLIDDVGACLDGLPAENEKRLTAQLEAAFRFPDNIGIPDLRQVSYRALADRIAHQLFPEEKDPAGKEKICRICHQDIRDFFASHYIAGVLSVLAKTDPGEAKRLTAETLLKFNHDTFDTEASSPILEALDAPVMPFERYRDHADMCLSLFRLMLFLARRSIGSTHNGTAEKLKMCGSFREGVDLTHAFILENPDVFCLGPAIPADEESKAVRAAVKELLNIDAEIHRRLKDFEKGIRISEELLRIADEMDDRELRFQAKNNIAKCVLYEGFYTAKASGTYSAEAEEKYRDALARLKSNAGSFFSANLYAMLLSTPDPVSSPYLDRVLGPDMAKRRLEACRTLEAVIQTSDPDKDYSLQTMLSYILHGYVRVGEDGRLSAGSCPDTRGNEAAVIRKALDMISAFSKPDVPAVRCFHGLILLRDPETFAEAVQKLNRSFRINPLNGLVEGLPLGCFICALLDPGLPEAKRGGMLKSVWNTLRKKCSGHFVDSFDAAYALADVRTAWKGILERFPDRAENGLRAGIDSELKDLTDLFDREWQQWNR